MAKPIAIEESLRQAGQLMDIPIYEKYAVLRHRLFTQEYTRWAAAFPGGNDHGPEHVMRVLEKLAQILGKDPIGRAVIEPYELFLTVMAVLYHDIGLLRGRQSHAEKSAIILGDERNEYLMDEHDRDIISVAVVSHSSSKDIARETAHLNSEEWIGNHRVRPRLIAALVRLADELDEDFRRADRLLQARVDLPEESKFYWEFSQRITGIYPNADAQEILIYVKSLKADINRNVDLEGRTRPFISAFADKLAKINRERVVVGTFLPDNLRYHRIRVSVKPIPGHRTWKQPREFTFFDSTDGAQFVDAFPELLKEPAKQQIINALGLIRENQLISAASILDRLEKVAQDLPTSVLLQVYYDAACIQSLKADSTDSKEERTLAVDRSLQYIKQWLALGLSGAWEEDGKDAYNEIYKVSRDSDLYRLFFHRRRTVVQLVPEDLRSALSTELPRRHPPGERSGGCVPKGTLIETPTGEVPIELLRKGDAVLSVDIRGSGNVFETRVEKVQTLREAECVEINRRHLFTRSHCLFSDGGKSKRTGDVTEGDLLLKAGFHHEEVRSVELITGYFEVFNITTDHISHNYIVDGLVCRNGRRYYK